MNVPSFGRDAAPHGRLLGTKGLPVPVGLYKDLLYYFPWFVKEIFIGGCLIAQLFYSIFSPCIFLRPVILSQLKYPDEKYRTLAYSPIGKGQ
jgi:hypothetical protein